MFSIGVYHPKKEVNVGGLYRSAHLFGASLLFTIGRRYKEQASDTTKSTRHIPLIEYETFEQFAKLRPSNSILIGVELTDKAIPLGKFWHPKNACYLFGAEDAGIPDSILGLCNKVIKIDYEFKASLNLATSGGIVMHHRHLQINQTFGKVP